MNKLVPLVSLFIFQVTAAFGSIASKCPDYSYDHKPFSFTAALIPDGASAPIGGVKRKDGQMMYRTIPAANPQFDQEKVIRAIFADQSAVVGSGTHYLLVNLIKDPSAQTDHMPEAALAVKEDDVVRKNLRILQDCHSSNAFTETEVQLLASDLLDKKFRYKQKQDYLDSLYLNDGYSRFYRDSAGEILYATYQPIVSAIYGSKTLVFKEETQRTMDKDYWHMKKFTAVHCSSPADVQETMSPGYILPDDVQGLIQRQSDNRFGVVNKATQLMVHRIKLSDGSVAAAVFDTEGEWAPMMGGKGIAYSSFLIEVPDSLSAAPVMNTSRVIPLLGIISNCQGAKCAAANAYTSSYPRKSFNTNLLYETNRALQTIGSNQPALGLNFISVEKEVVVAPAPAPAPVAAAVAAVGTPAVPVAPPVPRIQIISANWGADDVTPAVKDHCDGRKACDYKITNRYAFSGAAGKVGAGQFSIIWKCRGDRNTKTATSRTPADNDVLELSCYPN